MVSQTPNWPRVPRDQRTFADWFYTRGQQKRLRSNAIGRRSLGYVEQVGRMVYPPDMRRERQELATAQPPYKPRHRARGITRQSVDYKPKHHKETRR